MLSTRILFPLLHIIDVFLCLLFRRFCFSPPCACFTWNKLTNLYLQCSLFLTIDLLFFGQSRRKNSIFRFDEHGEGEWIYIFSLILFTRREGYTSTHTFRLFFFVVFTRQLGLPRWACYLYLGLLLLSLSLCAFTSTEGRIRGHRLKTNPSSARKDNLNQGMFWCGVTPMTGRKNRALQVPPVVSYKASGKFCMGQREVLALHDFSFLSSKDSDRLEWKCSVGIIMNKSIIFWVMSPDISDFALNQ